MLQQADSVSASVFTKVLTAKFGAGKDADRSFWLMNRDNSYCAYRNENGQYVWKQTCDFADEHKFIQKWVKGGGGVYNLVTKDGGCLGASSLQYISDNGGDAVPTGCAVFRSSDVDGYNAGPYGGDPLCTLIPEGDSKAKTEAMHACGAKCSPTRFVEVPTDAVLDSETYRGLQAGTGHFFCGDDTDLHFARQSTKYKEVDCRKRCESDYRCNFYSFLESAVMLPPTGKRGICKLSRTCDKLKYGGLDLAVRGDGKGYGWIVKKKVGCGHLNVVPLSYPDVVPKPFRGPALIPKPCHALAQQAKWKGSMCFLAENNQNPEFNHGFPSLDVSSNDPEDPVFYSSCFEQSFAAERTFEGNTCGDACLLGAAANRPDWRVGGKCLDCGNVDQLAGLSKDREVPAYSFASQCSACAPIPPVPVPAAPPPPPPNPPTPKPPPPTPPSPPPTETAGPCRPACKRAVEKKGRQWAKVCKNWKNCVGCQQCQE